MNRTKLYAAEATGRSTGETVITAWVVTVLLMPMKIPDAMTAGMSTALSVVQIAMTRTITANAARFRYIVLAMPNRPCRRGRAEHGEQGDEDAPAGEDQAEPDGAQVHRERRVARAP